MEGIYVAYLSGAEGYTALLFVLRNGRMTGADAGGVTYAGSYDVLEDRLSGTAIVSMPPNSQSITGAATGPDGATFSVPFQIRPEDLGTGFIVLETPMGPISAAVSKLQELP